MIRRLLTRGRFGVVAVVALAAFAGTTAATTAQEAAPAGPAGVLALPSPKAFVTNLDLECFRTNPYQPPALPGPLTLSHLNPVLAGLQPWTITSLGPREQLCAPVAKNGVAPPADVLPFVRFVDLSCYRINGPTANRQLTLSHLNPQQAQLPRRTVVIAEPEHLCLPVIKNNVVPPAEVLNLVRFIDVVCYRETPQVPLNIGMGLTQLNPVLAPIPTVQVGVTYNRQLCVPVRKNGQAIPADVLNIVRWVDLEKFDTVAPAMNTVNLGLRHINPLFQNWPTEPASLVGRQQLALPVAKNGAMPPA